MPPLPSLTARIDLRTALITLPGPVRHVLPIPYSASKQDVTLTVGAPARLTGRIRTAVGRPVADATIEVWARTSVPLNASSDLIHTPEPVSMGAVPLRNLGPMGRSRLPGAVGWIDLPSGCS